MSSEPIKRPRVRLTGLDGLRGIAALVVVLDHSMFVNPQLFASYLRPRDSGLTGLAWWWVYSPLHLLWDGSVAVFVFFVLSGVVLTLPFRSPPRRWASYYPSRLVRLYIPSAGAVGFALLGIALVPHLQPGSRWLDRAPVTLSGVLKDLSLVIGSERVTNTALWSLRWEVLFSVGLPLFLAFALLQRRWWAPKLVLVCALLLVGSWYGDPDVAFSPSPAFQLSIFAVGCLIAAEWESIHEATRRWLHGGPRFVAVAVVLVLAMSAYWVTCGLMPGTHVPVLLAATRMLQVLGAAGLVILAGSVPAVSAFLSTPVVHWLGTRSFSLYLVHEPVVVALGRLLPTPANPLVTAVLAVAISLGVTEVFFRIVERPSHRLSQRIRRGIVERQEQRRLSRAVV